ncbi:hypothetical protein BpHYR1_006320 [Brachionus plicatilis]|uniref:Uncharacterized protein n=1 Tax=Brachionus plicatilis TaxID=10195 RepID=A0A3M7QIT0_BRAPC|nr:hypothetical protein BpHYR1_006320 [Brachionus plicatilis]
MKIAVRFAHLNFESNFASKCKKEPKLLYSYINNQKICKESIKMMKEPDGTITTANESIVNILNDLFCMVFNTLSDGLLKFPVLDAKISNKFIQFECTRSGELCGGWGDRLKGILSTYAISMIIDRKFTIKMTRDCDLRRILEPNEINWDHEQVPLKVKSKQINIGWEFSFYDIFRNDISLFTNNEDTPLIKVKAGIQFANVLRENKNLKQKIESLGYKVNQFHIVHSLHKWYNQLFKLNKESQKKYEWYLRRLKPNLRTKLICVQIRTGDPDSAQRRDYYTRKEYWRFIDENFLNSSDSDKYKIFVTSDYEPIKEEAKSYFPKNEVIYNENSSFHIDKQGDKECKGLESVIFDFHMMQNCDIGVISHSGYGLLALLNRPDPFKELYVYSKEHKHQKVTHNNQASYYSPWKNLTWIKFSKLGDIIFF